MHVEKIKSRIKSKITINNRGCHIWSGSTNGKGRYPIVTINDKKIRISRLFLEEKLGRPINPGLNALHICDNKKCVNPEHIYEGTQKQNAKDASDRGLITGSILSEELKQIIRSEYVPKKISLRFLASKYNVSHSTISNVVKV